MNRVVLHIDNLVLKGFRPEDRHALAAALQAELTRALAQPLAARQLAQSGSVTKLRLASVRVATNAQPQQVGAATGSAVASGLLK